MDRRCLEPVISTAWFANGFPQTAVESQQGGLQAEATELTCKVMRKSGKEKVYFYLCSHK